MKKNYYLWILLIIVQVFVIQNTYAQQGMITGIVKDVNGEPIIGASVKVQGTLCLYVNVSKVISEIY